MTGGLYSLLFFTEEVGKIGRITPAGGVTEFPIPTADSQPLGITAGPDGNPWFTEASGKQIGRLTPRGAGTPVALPTPGSRPAPHRAGGPRHAGVSRAM